VEQADDELGLEDGLGGLQVVVPQQTPLVVGQRPDERIVLEEGFSEEKKKSNGGKTKS